MKEYDDHGIRFRYPEDWVLGDDSSDERVSVTVQSADSAFWTVAVFPDGPDPAEVVESAVEAYRDDYDELDAYEPTPSASAKRKAAAREMEFVCLDLIATANVRAYRAGPRTVMVLYQAADVELEDRRPVFEAMTASLEVDAADDEPT